MTATAAAEECIFRPYSSSLDLSASLSLQSVLCFRREGPRLQMNEFLHFRAPHEKLGKGSVKSRAGES